MHACCKIMKPKGSLKSLWVLPQVGQKSNSSENRWTLMKKCVLSLPFCEVNTLFFHIIIAPSVKLVKLAKRNVTVKINDSDGYRSKIDGYFITWYIPGDRSRHAQQLSPNKSLYTFGWLLLNTSYVIEVTSFKGRIASDRSKAIKIRTKSQGMPLLLPRSSDARRFIDVLS